MIKVNIKKAARREGIKNPYRLAQRLQGTTSKPEPRFYRLADALWQNDCQPKLETLDLVCNTLGCGLAEILTHTPNGRKKT